MSPPGHLAETIRLQARSCDALGCRFYAALCEELARDVERDAPISRFLAPFGGARFEDAYVLRLLGGVHRLVLDGRAPAVAAHYPSVGGDGDAHAAARVVEELLADPPPELRDGLRRPPQTNEVGRSAALASGLLVVAAETGLPIRVRELGASGGLNLRLDSYWYERDGAGWGNTRRRRCVSSTFGSAAARRSVRVRRSSTAAAATGTRSIRRRSNGAQTLLSYVWPEPAARFVHTRDAIALAHDVPVAIDRADVVDWLPTQLEGERPGTTLVVMHSVVWQYLDSATQDAIAGFLRRAGERATPQSPLAWLRLEPHPVTYAPAELRLMWWDGRAHEPQERLLATTSFHGGEMTWLA